MKNLLDYIVRKIVDKNQDVEINESPGEFDENLFNIKVKNDQIGQVIGKNGNIINAIRALARILAVKQNLRIRVNVEN